MNCPAMGPDPVATHGSVRDDPRSCSCIPSSIPGIPAAGMLSLQPPLSIGRRRTGQGLTSVARRADSELTSPQRLAGKSSGNSAATLGQLCVNRAGRVEGVDHGYFRSIGDAVRSVAV